MARWSRAARPTGEGPRRPTPATTCRWKASSIPATSTISYIVFDRQTRACALIDSVLDYDPKSGRTSHASADRLLERVRELGATVQWILETHVHADHLSAAPYLKQALGGRLAIGEQSRPCRRCSARCSTPAATSPRRTPVRSSLR